MSLERINRLKNCKREVNACILGLVGQARGLGKYDNILVECIIDNLKLCHSWLDEMCMDKGFSERKVGEFNGRFSEEDGGIGIV